MERVASAIVKEPAGLEFLWLEVTNRCNLQCRHCYAESGPYEPLSHGLKHEDWLSILEEAAEIGCTGIQFIGGEPLLYPKLHELIRFAYKNGFKLIEVFTNGTRLTVEDISVFRKYGVRFAFSYYSTDGVIHDAITQVRSSHRKTRHAIEAAHAAGISVRVGVIEMEQNKGAYADVVSELASIGIEDVGLDHVRAIGRGSCDGKPDLTALCGNCWKGRLAINSKGEVAGCIMAHAWKLGDVSQGLRSILSGQQLHDFRLNVMNLQHSNICECGPDCGPARCSPTYCRPRFECTPKRERPCYPEK